jgi:hypothetical protein
MCKTELAAGAASCDSAAMESFAWSTRAIRRLAAAALCCAALVGCVDVDGGSTPPQSGGQTGGEGIKCAPVKTLSLPLDESSPLGFSGDQALLAIEGDWTRTLTWAEGGTTDVVVAVTYAGDGTVEWQDREWINEATGQEAQQTAALGDCLDVLELPITIDFTTADGAFAETWTDVALAETTTYATYTHQLDLSALEGTYQLSAVPPDELDSVTSQVDITFEDSWVLGTIHAQRTNTDDAGGGDTAVDSQRIDIATF